MSGDEEARYYAERDRRSGQYMPEHEPVPVGPVGLIVGADAAGTPAGQLATLGLVNMLARVHRTLVVEIPDVPVLLSPMLVTASTLGAAVAGIAKAINPYVRLAGFASAIAVPTVGIGTAAPVGLDGYLVVDGWSGGVSRAPSPVGRSEASLLGAGSAACLGAAFLFGCARGRSPEHHVVSLWGLAERADHSGPDLDLPLDVGNVLVIGAGAVGSSLAFWLAAVGSSGDWSFIDPDIVRLHNTNRGLGMTAQDAGWPITERGAHKAMVAARFLGPQGRAFTSTYREWLETHPNDRPDLVIPVANEDGVRSAVMGRGEPILLHGSTSADWTAELHRHIPDVDDCIPCRLPDSKQARFTCSEGPTDPADSEASTDAALPFLSGAAGLLVVSALAKLSLGAIDAQASNHWRLHLELAHRPVTATRWCCSRGCRNILSRDIRKAVQGGGRWDHIDSA